MVKDKERSVNPAAAARKADKLKAIKKNKSSTQALRNEKLARRNPERLQTQIADLKALESKGDLKPREKSILDELEKDLRAINRARDALGDKAPRFGSGSGSYRRDGDGNGHGNVLGKRRHDGQRKEFQEPTSDNGSVTDEDVRRIPMPKDTPPPLPRSHRRPPQHQGTDANNEPLGVGQGTDRMALPAKPLQTQTTYTSAPQIRDLKLEAVKRFVPNIVRKKQQAVRGVGGLVEPEELDRLEMEGYGAGAGAKKDSALVVPADPEIPADTGGEEARRLAEEEERFRREMEMEMEMEMETEGEVAMEGVEDTSIDPPPLKSQETTSRTRRLLQPLVEDVSDEDI
jgi:hypothetical protein